jgi:hypothetical protein
VKSITFTNDNIMIVFFSEQQFFDLIRFGTVAENFSKASIDTTFDIGKLNFRLDKLLLFIYYY